MATTISSIDAQILKLAPTFQTAIKTIIESESTPLKNTQTQKDSIDVRRGIYTDMKANFDALQSSLQALVSTEATYGMASVSKSVITPGTVGSSVLTAEIGETALAAEYDISVTKLAKAHSLSSAAVASPDVALGKSGTFWLGGTGLADIQTETAPGVYGSFVATTTVTAASTSSVADGQRELGAGDYSLQTRDLNGVRQFRLVDADGNAVSIRNQSGTDYTSSWQTMTSGSYDTGRGLTFTLDTQGTDTSTSMHYTAAGTSITINSTDTMRTIVSAINSASQPDGRDFKASIVANQLVLTAATTGENHSLIFSDGASLGITNLLQSAQNAQFTVNGMSVSRASNTNLMDVLDGVTLNLAGDAEGKSARLSVTSSYDKAINLVKTLVEKFNAAMTHLKNKLSSTSSTNAEGKTIYTRGPLTGDVGISGLRFDLFSRMNRNYANSGTLKNFSEIGITLDKDNKLVFDAAIFGEVINSNNDDVKALLDAGMGEINTLVSRYAGSSGTLSRTLDDIDGQRTAYDNRITKLNERLTARKEVLYNQYYGYQNQLVELNYQQQMFSAVYYGSATSIGSNVNSSG